LSVKTPSLFVISFRSLSIGPALSYHSSTVYAKVCQSVDAVKHKIKRLGLEEEGTLISNGPSSSNLDTEGELQSVEEALKMLNGALNALKTGHLDKTEIFQL